MAESMKHVAPQAFAPREGSGSPATGKITASIASLERGLEVYEGVRMIRIKSVDHTLLIMEDYMPVLGEVRGSVTVCRGDEELGYEGIRGFYVHTHNEFSLIIDRESNG